MRPGRTRRSSSRVVMAPRLGAIRGDGARMLEILRLFGESASRGYRCRWRIPQSSQPHAPDRGPAFSLAVRGLVASAPLRPHAKLSDSPPDTDEAEGNS